MGGGGLGAGLRAIEDMEESRVKADMLAGG